MQLEVLQPLSVASSSPSLTLPSRTTVRVVPLSDTEVKQLRAGHVLPDRVRCAALGEESPTAVTNPQTSRKPNSRDAEGDEPGDCPAPERKSVASKARRLELGGIKSVDIVLHRVRCCAAHPLPFPHHLTVKGCNSVRS